MDFDLNAIRDLDVSNFSDVRPQGKGTEVTVLSEAVYEQFLADVWVGIVLTLMVLSCVCFMCSCLIYHKFQEWKNRVVETRSPSNLEAGLPEVELPSYTIASGLPSYAEAMEQLKKVKELQTNVAGVQGSPPSDSRYEEPPPPPPGDLSVFSLFGIYNRGGSGGESGASKLG